MMSDIDEVKAFKEDRKRRLEEFRSCDEEIRGGILLTDHLHYCDVKRAIRTSKRCGEKVA